MLSKPHNLMIDTTVGKTDIKESQLAWINVLPVCLNFENGSNAKI